MVRCTIGIVEKYNFNYMNRLYCIWIGAQVARWSGVEAAKDQKFCQAQVDMLRYMIICYIELSHLFVCSAFLY